MSRCGGWGSLLAITGTLGCGHLQSPMPANANIRTPTPIPQLQPPELPPAKLPDPPRVAKSSPVTPSSDDNPLGLQEVLTSVEGNFPLLYAIEQERTIASGQRLTAEGQFDLALRSRGIQQAGTFSNGRLDFGLEQPNLIGGIGAFSGWRYGQGNYPIYYGDRKTGDGGEFRSGLNIPLLQNREIDPRRARLRAAQIQEQIADPVIRRARLDYLRSAAQAYWNWVGAGAQYQVAEELLKLARDRQSFIDEQRRQQLVSETVQVLNRRLIASREETLLTTERLLQQAAFRLSLFLRNAQGDPIVVDSKRLPPGFFEMELTPPSPEQLTSDISTALAQRPELVRFQLQKERLGVELKLADNQLYPTLNIVTAVAQDVGALNKTFIGVGSFASDRTAVEFGATLEVPVQRRDALGRIRTIQGQLAQTLAQERFTRDEITAQIQDAISELVKSAERVSRAREELKQAIRVRDLETESFRAGRTSLVDLNIQEVAAAEARTKVVALLATYQRAVAEYRAALGSDAASDGPLPGLPPVPTLPVPAPAAAPTPAPQPAKP